MGFKSFWRSVAQIAPYVSKSAVVAQAVVPGKAGEIAGEVGAGAGVVGTIVNHVQAETGRPTAGGVEVAHADALRVVAASADEHESRIKALEARIESLTASTP